MKWLLVFDESIDMLINLSFFIDTNIGILFHIGLPFLVISAKPLKAVLLLFKTILLEVEGEGT